MEPDSREPAMRRLLLTMTMAVLPLAAAQAQIPGKQMVSGQVHPTLAQASPGGAWCFVGRGLSVFQASADGSQAAISLPEVIYFDGTTYYALNGQTHLSFTTPTSGDIRFKFTPEYPAVVANASFSNYSEAPGTAPNIAAVSFSVNFTNGTNSSICTLPVTIRYEAE
jgi:hypothetical protein